MLEPGFDPSDIPKTDHSLDEYYEYKVETANKESEPTCTYDSSVPIGLALLAITSIGLVIATKITGSTLLCILNIATTILQSSLVSVIITTGKRKNGE